MSVQRVKYVSRWSVGLMLLVVLLAGLAGLPGGDRISDAQDDGGLRSRDQLDPRANQRLLPVTPPPASGQRWKMGIEAEDLDYGTRITHVYNDTPASRAGLEVNDVIVTVNGYQVGMVQGQLFDAGEEFQRRADRRGFVSLLVWNGRDGSLVNRTVRLERNLGGIPRPNRPVALNGRVTYRERIALSRSAVLEVRLVDANARVLPVVLADATFTNIGQSPIPFSLEYEQADVDPNQTYVLEAQIWDRGRMLMATRRPVPAIVRGRPQPLEVQVQSLR